MRTLKPLVIIAAGVLAAPAAFGADPLEIRELTPQIPLEYPLPPELVLAPFQPEPDVVIQTSGAHFYKQALTSTKPRTMRSERFEPLPGARTRVVVPAGIDVLVNVAFTAESRCTEPDSTAPNWCEVRILVDGAEADPAASSFPPDTYALDSTDSGSETPASWESHAMDRHRCVFNSGSRTARVVPVEVQWKVTNFDGGVAPDFWLDDWSLTVELARGCRRTEIEKVDPQ